MPGNSVSSRGSGRCSPYPRDEWLHNPLPVELSLRELVDLEVRDRTAVADFVLAYGMPVRHHFCSVEHASQGWPTFDVPRFWSLASIEMRTNTSTPSG